MNFSDECLRSCVTVCRSFSDFERPLWRLPLLMLMAGTVGFLAGRLDTLWRFLSCLRQIVVSPAELWCSLSRREAAVASFRTERCKHACLIRTSSIDTKFEGKKLRDPVVKETVHASRSETRHEETPPETSPQSDSSSGSSFMRDKLSPLLVGSRKTTPSGSSLENSPAGSDRRTQRDFPDAEASGSSGNQSYSPTPQTAAPKGPETKLAALLSGNDTLPAAAWMSGKDAVAMNAQCDFKWLDLVEASLDAIHGNQWTESVHPDDLLHCKDVIALATSVREPFQMEYRLKVTEENFRWVLDIGKPRFSSCPETFLGFVGWRIDIHERKTIENNYWKYWVLPHEFLVNWSGDCRYFKDVSPAFPCFLGYKMEEFLAVPWMDLLHDDDRSSTAEALSELKEGKAVASLVNRCRCKGDKVDGPTYVDSTGTYKWLNWTASEAFAACRDITADKLAQEALKQSQKELQRITDAIPGGIFLYQISEEGQESFSYVSKGARDLLGCDLKAEGSHSGKRILGMRVHPDDYLRLEEKMKQVLDLQTYLDLDYRILKGREVQWIRVHAVPRRHSRSTEWSGIGWDITEQHQVVDALKEARDNAEKAAHAKGNFLAHMSHEIRTPMNAVIGMGALLLETNLTDEQREYASTIRASGEALLGIINDILDYSKVEAGKMELELQPIEILQCVESSFDQVVPQAALKNLELTYTVSESLPPVVLADSVRIRQILVNLLTNAVKFTSHGGISVNVDGRLMEDSTRMENGKAYRGGMRRSSKWEIEFSVRDCGIGIPDDRKSGLFQAFTQVDASTTRRYGGTGLGLAICFRLCALHGGRIWIENNAGGGAIFRFTVVAEEVRQSLRHASEQELGIQSLNNKRVLIVAGSSSSTQTMCARLLKSWHMRPVCTSSSDEALRLLRKLENASNATTSHLVRENSPLGFDAVIFDCSLLDSEDPEVMECLELCHTTLETVPTLLLTPFGRRAREYYSGKQPVHFDGLISKPIKESHLLNTLLSLFVQVPHEESFQFSRGPPPRACGRDVPVVTADSNAPPALADIGKMYPLSILVAEDNVINQKVMLKLLLRLGYSADVVANGVQALDVVRRKAYDVILMDCFMPEMDGLEATRRIRETVSPVPTIVAVTAAALEDEMQACLQAGMHMYISKPIQADELMQALAKCWHVKQAS